MCGIIGFATTHALHSVDDMVETLRRLEYRGYDSAGIALIDDQNACTIIKAVGKIRALEEAVRQTSAEVHPTSGMGHTRWATHGKPSEINAHPHQHGRVTLVHNGILTNDVAIRQGLAREGVSPVSDTDSELLAIMLDRALRTEQTPLDALRATLAAIEGLFAFAASPGIARTLLFARRGSPLALGIGIGVGNGSGVDGDGDKAGRYYLGSDGFALAEFCRSVIYLEDGDHGIITDRGYTLFNDKGEAVERPIVPLNAAQWLVDKGNHSHFMHKEIHEQPGALGNQLAQLAPPTGGEEVFALPPALIKRLALSPIVMTACGSAAYACYIARHWFERLAIGGGREGMGVAVEVASELKNRRGVYPQGTLAIIVSQSGETMDTLTAMTHLRDRGVEILAIVNNTDSSIARAATYVVPTLAGPEIGVASTKAFTAQLMVLGVLGLAARDWLGGQDDSAASLSPSPVSSAQVSPSPGSAAQMSLAQVSLAQVSAAEVSPSPGSAAEVSPSPGSAAEVSPSPGSAAQVSAAQVSAAQVSASRQTLLDLAMLRGVAVLANQLLRADDQIADAVALFADARSALFLGRGAMHPVAMEGALKLKEVSYIHAEGCAAGEMKHGPIALVDATLPVVVLAPSNDGLFEKTYANIKEIGARGGRLLVLTDEAGASVLQSGGVVATVLLIPSVGGQAPDQGGKNLVHPDGNALMMVLPMLYTIALQTLAYHVAVARGTDVDQPRNLAKSVTVE